MNKVRWGFLLFQSCLVRQQLIYLSVCWSHLDNSSLLGTWGKLPIQFLFWGGQDVRQPSGCCDHSVHILTPCLITLPVSRKRWYDHSLLPPFLWAPARGAAFSLSLLSASPFVIWVGSSQVRVVHSCSCQLTHSHLLLLLGEVDRVGSAVLAPTSSVSATLLSATLKNYFSTEFTTLRVEEKKIWLIVVDCLSRLKQMFHKH